MVVNVRLFGYLTEYRGKGSPEEFTFDIPENSGPRDLLNLLDIPKKEIMLVINPGTEERVLAISDSCAEKGEVTLEANDTIWIYPFLNGG
jgi:hypothetical protein